MSLARQLHAASLPFVTRALRGGQRVRLVALALLLALVSVALGAWLALGPGRFEHGMRVELGLERSLAAQERLGFKLIAADPREAVELHRLVQAHRSAPGLARIAANPYPYGLELEDRVVDGLRQGLEDLMSAAHGRHVGLIDLERPAHALLARFQLEDSEPLGTWDRGDDLEHHQRVERILARELRPTIEVYRSPLALADAARLTGLIAGGLTLLLLMLLAPVLAGTQMAQEVHENTLQPLTGTALSARELVLGLSFGPAVVVALLAAPQVALLLAAALAVGHLLPALALVLVSLIGGAFLTMLAQLAGLALGRTRTPGILGVALLAALAPLTMFGLALALELPRAATGVLALLPQAAAGHSLFEAFIPAGTGVRPTRFDPVELAALGRSVALGALGMLVFAYLGLRALERRVGELAPAALTRGEALVGAALSIALVLHANPWHGHIYDPTGYYLGNLALALVPLTILLMMRVPLGDTPPALRRVPFGGLLLEFTVGVALCLAAATACMGVAPHGLLGSPVALAYLAWTVAVTGLLAVRVVALPMTLLAKVWAGVGVLGVGVAFAHTVAWSRGDLHGPPARVLALWDISPPLGVLQAVLMALIPALLVRTLQNRGARSATDA